MSHPIVGGHQKADLHEADKVRNISVSLLKISTPCTWSAMKSNSLTDGTMN